MAKKSKAAPSAPKLRSTASVFSLGDFEDISSDSVNRKKQKKIEQERRFKKMNEHGENDDPTQYGFPLNVIFYVQDFLNESLNFCKFVQLLVCGYIAQVFYLGFTEELHEKASVIGFNVLAIVLGLVLTFRSTMAKSKQNPRIAEPTVPEFNLVYAVFIPIALSLLLDLKFFLINLALNYFVVENLHPLAQLGASVMYYQIYNEDTFPTVYFIAVSLLHLIITTAISSINQGSHSTETELSKEVIEQDNTVDHALVNHINKSGNNVTLAKAEIHLLSVFLINLLLNFLNSFDISVVIFQKLIVSLLVTLAIVYPVFKVYEYQDHSKVLAVVVTALFSSLFYYATVYQLEPILGENPLVWLFNYITNNGDYANSFRFKVLTAWLLLLLVLIPIVYGVSDSLSLNSRRKVWHYVLMVSILPVLTKDPSFVCLALLGSFFVFILMEIIRYNRFTFLGAWLYDRLVCFQDFKDLKGPLNLSYIFLLLGVVLPIAYDYAILGQGVTIRSFIGIISLGVGDSIASTVGKKYGSIKWRLGTKSLQGTLAFLGSTALGFWLVDTYLLEASTNYENLFIVCFLGSLLEGSATLNDNFLIPCMMLIAFEVLRINFP